MLFEAIVAGLTHRGESLREYAGDPDDCERARLGPPCVSGIALVVLPWDRYMALAIRLSSDADDVRYSEGDWKHLEFVSSMDKLPKFRAATEYVADAYDAADKNGLDSREMAHLIFQAAAEALGDERVTAALQCYGVDVWKIEDRFPQSVFEYMVFDHDKTIKANYCDILLANRLSRRFLGRTI
jgi:hypothetical protein